MLYGITEIITDNYKTYYLCMYIFRARKILRGLSHNTDLPLHANTGSSGMFAAQSDAVIVQIK